MLKDLPSQLIGEVVCVRTNTQTWKYNACTDDQRDKNEITKIPLVPMTAMNVQVSLFHIPPHTWRGALDAAGGHMT